MAHVTCRKRSCDDYSWVRSRVRRWINGAAKITTGIIKAHDVIHADIHFDINGIPPSYPKVATKVARPVVTPD